eukprot:Pompholyxophrys_punicea_v1_NODE_301_length_2325_cov_5.422907.p2 type:complete len:111 gc:universal NODE_301_length_2325_cov_5.422907:1304-972(-)
MLLMKNDAEDHLGKRIRFDLICIKQSTLLFKNFIISLQNSYNWWLFLRLLREWTFFVTLPLAGENPTVNVTTCGRCCTRSTAHNTFRVLAAASFNFRVHRVMEPKNLLAR